MKHYSVTRVVAITTLTCLLTLFALPAAAGPFGGVAAEGIWSPASLLHWVQSVWTGWFGPGADSGDSTPIRNVHGALDHQLDPDGAKTSSETPGGDDGSLSGGSIAVAE